MTEAASVFLHMAAGVRRSGLLTEEMWRGFI